MVMSYITTGVARLSSTIINNNKFRLTAFLDIADWILSMMTLKLHAKIASLVLT